MRKKKKKVGFLDCSQKWFYVFITLVTAFLAGAASYWTVYQPSFGYKIQAVETLFLSMPESTYSGKCYMVFQELAGWGFWFFNYVGQQECADDNLSLIRQSGMTNKIAVAPVPWVSQSCQGNKSGTGQFYLLDPRGATVDLYFHSLNNRTINWKSLKETNHAIIQLLSNLTNEELRFCTSWGD